MIDTKLSGSFPSRSRLRGPPVITTRSGRPIESVVDGETEFLVEPNSVNTLAEKILYFDQNKQVAESMGIAGRKNVETIFSWEKATEQLLEVFPRYVRGHPTII